MVSTTVLKLREEGEIAAYQNNSPSSTSDSDSETESDSISNSEIVTEYAHLSSPNLRESISKEPTTFSPTKASQDINQKTDCGNTNNFNTISVCHKFNDSSEYTNQSIHLREGLVYTPEQHRLSAGAAFVPLSDRIPKFLRAHQDSDFIIMATPKEPKQSRSIKDRSRNMPSTSYESSYFEGNNRRSSLLVAQEDFEYCSATQPLQGGQQYNRNFHKKSRPLYTAKLDLAREKEG